MTVTNKLHPGAGLDLRTFWMLLIWIEAGHDLTVCTVVAAVHVVLLCKALHANSMVLFAGKIHYSLVKISPCMTHELNHEL